jgi:uncharacterized membrane protein
VRGRLRREDVSGRESADVKRPPDELCRLEETDATFRLVCAQGYTRRGGGARNLGIMEAKARLLGHPIHQMLIVLPLGLLLGGWLFDLGFTLLRRPVLGEIGFWNTAAGILSGLVAAVFGLIDWTAIPAGTRAKVVGLWHAGANVLMLVLFAASWYLRRNVAGHAPYTTTLILATVAMAIGGVSGWLGGELVDRLGIGVTPGAHVDAPSSLSGKMP